MRELITIKGTQRACLYGLGVLGLLGPSPPAKSKTWTVLIAAENKGKAIPVQTWIGPENSGRLRLPNVKIIGT
jgi:hypothetical protein